MSTAMTYAEFAAREARGSSAAYEDLSVAVSRDPALLARLDSLPPPKRQPNLLYAVVRHLGGPVTDPRAFLAFTADHWPTIEAQLLTRATQTNEPGRCALLLPVLAALPQPLALLEVGASAGLNLFPDRYAYRYSPADPPDFPAGPARGAGPPLFAADPTPAEPGGPRVLPAGPAPVDLATDPPLLDCALAGIAPPVSRPEVVWRAGLDLNPLDVTDPSDVAWLDALIWPEHDHRRRRLAAAARIAAADPPELIRGDLLDDLPALAARAPAGATLVVFHTSVLYQVPEPRRAAFAALTRTLPGHWLAVENPTVFPHADLPPPPGDTLHNVLALDGRPLAWCRAHGEAMTWFGPQ